MADPGELPLFDWAERSPSTTSGRWRLRGRFAVGALGVAFLAMTIVTPPLPRLLWNASASAPIGLYAVSPHAPIARGDMVVARPPHDAGRFAARRHYLPAGVPLVKRVAAGNGDRVCAKGEAVSINQRRAATRLRIDSAGRFLPWWRGCITVGKAEVFLLMPAANSFDSRYFGLVQTRDIIGKAVPLWLR